MIKQRKRARSFLQRAWRAAAYNVDVSRNAWIGRESVASLAGKR